MSQLVISAENLTTHFNDLCEKIKKDLEKKEKKEVDLSSISFYVDYAQRIQAVRVADLFNRKPSKPEFIADSYGFDSLSGQLGRKKSSVKLSEGQCQVVISLLKDQWEAGQREQENERARFNALTEEERQQEMDDNLRELSRSPGFAAFRITPNKSEK